MLERVLLARCRQWRNVGHQTQAIREVVSETTASFAYEIFRDVGEHDAEMRSDPYEYRVVACARDRHVAAALVRADAFRTHARGSHRRRSGGETERPSSIRAWTDGGSAQQGRGHPGQRRAALASVLRQRLLRRWIHARRRVRASR